MAPRQQKSISYCFSITWSLINEVSRGFDNLDMGYLGDVVKTPILGVIFGGFPSSAPFTNTDKQLKIID
jgi:hypothetical protein